MLGIICYILCCIVYADTADLCIYGGFLLVAFRFVFFPADTVNTQVYTLRVCVHV